MKFWKGIHEVAYWYVIASVPIGLGLVYVVPMFSPGPIGDCEDDTWGKLSRLQRATTIHHYWLIMQIGALIMFAIGVLVLLFAKDIRDRNTATRWPVGVVFMMTCFGLLAWVASGPNC